MITRGIALALLLVLSGVASAQTTTSTSTSTSLQVTPPFPSLSQGAIGSAQTLVLANGQQCNGTPCETGPFHITGSDYPGPTVYFDCDGTCVASVVCRMPGQKKDVTLAASGTLVDASAKVAITAFCPSAYLDITTCTTCNVRAWLVNSKAY